MFSKTYELTETLYNLFNEVVQRKKVVVPNLAAALARKHFNDKMFEGLEAHIETKIVPMWNYEVEKQPKHGVMKPHWEEEDFIYYRYDEIVDDRVAWGGTRDVWVTGTFDNKIINRDVIKPSPELLGSLIEK